MKNLILLFSIVGVLVYSCGSPKKSISVVDNKQEEPVRIANDSLAYEIIIMDIGFNNYLSAIAKPTGFYSQQYLESRNRIYVIEWNQRVANPLRYDSSIYENTIDYQSDIDYGMEVNYKLYNYFQFAQKKYNMRLAGFRVF